MQGQVPSEFSGVVIQVQLMTEENSEPIPVPLEVQKLIQAFAEVFTEPVGLPPNRGVTHSIPLIQGARPVQIRPYRFAPELKNEIEQQIHDMLQSGVI